MQGRWKEAGTPYDVLASFPAPLPKASFLLVFCLVLELSSLLVISQDECTTPQISYLPK